MVSEILGYEVKSTLKTALLYRSVSGGRDYFIDLTNIQTKIIDEHKVEISAGFILDLFYAMVLTASGERYTQKKHDDFLNSFDIADLNEISADVLDIITQTNETEKETEVAEVEEEGKPKKKAQ